MPVELDLFSQRPISIGVENHELIELSPLNSITDATLLEYNCPGYVDKYKSLSDIYLRLRIKLVKSDGTEYTATDKIQPYLLNNIAFSIFRGLVVTLGNQVVLQVDNYYHIKEYIEVRNIIF